MTTFSQDGLAFGAPEIPRRFAVIIGINKYPFLGGSDLDGSVNDAIGYKAVLLERFGFDEDQVTLLVDEAATHDAILGALDRLVATVHDGDPVVLTYSGHGRRIQDPDSREPDRMDETFVPADSGSGFFPNRDIRDDEFLARIVALTERGAYVTFFCDCCHSSASLRDEFSASTRGIAADRRRNAQQQAALPADLRSVPSPPRQRPAAALRRDRYVYVAACRDSELATEHIEQNETGPQVQGALSFYLQRELFASRPGQSMQQVIDRAFAALSTECPGQHPRAEGALSEAPLFVADERPSEAGGDVLQGRALVQRRFEKSVVLSVGRLHGETQGSLYTIHPPPLVELSGPGDQSLGLVEVTAVNATTVSAKILGENTVGAIRAGCLAVELSHSAVLPPLRLQIAPAPEFSAAISALTADLATRPAIQVVQGGTAQLRLYALGPRPEPSLGSSAEIAVPPVPVPQLGALSQAVWALVGRDGRLRAPPLPLRAATGIGDISGLLRELATYQMVLNLEERTSRLRTALQANLYRRRPGQGEWQPVQLAVDALPLAEVGDELSLSVSLLESDVVPAGRVLHLAVLYLAASGEVQVWSAERDNPSQVAAGRVFVLGQRAGEQRRLHIAPGFPPTGWEDPAAASARTSPLEGAHLLPSDGQRGDPAGPRVQDIVKIIVGTRPLLGSFQLLWRKLREGGLASYRPSELSVRLLANALRGRKVRRSSSSLPPLSPLSAQPSSGLEPGAGESGAEEWAALSLPLIVERPR